MSDAPRPRQPAKFPDPYPEMCAAFRRTPGSLCLTEAEWKAAHAGYMGERRRLVLDLPSAARTKAIQPGRCEWVTKHGKPGDRCPYQHDGDGARVDPIAAFFQDPRNLLDKLHMTRGRDFDHVSWHLAQMKPDRRPRPRVTDDADPLAVIDYLASRAFLWGILRGERKGGMSPAQLRRQYKYLPDVPWDKVEERTSDSPATNAYLDAGKWLGCDAEALRVMLFRSKAAMKP